MSGALLHMLVGHPAAAERWAEAAEHGAAAATLPEPGTVAALLALGRAFMCRDGVERMRGDAELTLERLSIQPMASTRAAAGGDRVPAGRSR